MRFLVQRIAAKLPHGYGEAGRDKRLFSQDRVFLDDKADVPIRLHQFCHLVIGLAAISASIVGEFDHRDVAFGIAAHPAGRIVENLCGMGLQKRGIVLRFKLGLPGIQHIHRFDQHVRVVQQIGLHLGPEDLPLGGGHGGQVGPGRDCKGQGQQKAGCDQSGHGTLLGLCPSIADRHAGARQTAQAMRACAEL